MQQAIPVLSAPLAADLSPLTKHLWAEKIAHRVIEEGDQQLLLVADPADVERIGELLRQWDNGELGEPQVVQTSNPDGLLQRAMRMPLTVSLILLLAAVFGWQHISPEWHTWLQANAQLWPDARNSVSTYLNMGFWELWRPTLLHFSTLHLLSNVLWIWVFAGAMERIGERGPILAVLLFSGLAGNVLQWWLAGPAFGGASGAVYGLAAWTGLRQTRFKVPYGIPPALLGIMIMFMLFTIVGDTVFPGLSGTANGGHLGGLLCGFLMAMLWPLPNRGNNDA